MESIQREIGQMNITDFSNSLAVELGNYLEVCGPAYQLVQEENRYFQFQFATRRLF